MSNPTGRGGLEWRSDQPSPRTGRGAGRGDSFSRGGWSDRGGFSSRGERGGWRGRGDTSSRGGRGGRGDSSSRGARGGRGDSSSRGARGGQKRREQPKPDLDKHPLGKLLTSMSDSDLIEFSESLSSAATITDCKYAASYNWLDHTTPTILVPGKPPLWSPLKEPRRLNEDKGEYFRDPNGAKFPSYPTEAAVRAILEADPTLPTSNIDIFACGSTMGNLLRFVRNIDKPFRFNIEVVGDTVFFIRKENSPRELLLDVHGYGHTFPEAYTTWEAEVKGSETHQRIIQYKFGGLNCLLRFECDGYVDDSPKGGLSKTTPLSKTSSDDDELLKAFEDLAGPTVTKGVAELNDILSIKIGGHEVPQSSIFDLKTRSGRFKKQIDMSEYLPILYLRQIPNFVVAYHDGEGLFPTCDVNVQNIKKDLDQWEMDNKDALQRLAKLLHELVGLAKKDEKGLLEVYCPRANHLEIHQQHGDGAHALPPSLREEWSGVSQPFGEDSDTEYVDALDDLGKDFGQQGFEFDSDSDDEAMDFTACSAEDCGYCGKCSY